MDPYDHDKTRTILQPVYMMARSSEDERAGKRPLPESPAGRALREAVDLVLSGTAHAEAAKRFGVPLDALHQAESAYHQGGWPTLNGSASRPMLRRKLTHEQELELHALIRTNLPDTLGLKALLWNRDAVHDLVQQRTGIALATRTLATYLERWGFAPTKPLQRFYQHDPARMREWMRRDYPIIAMQAREANAQLAWWGVGPLAARERTKTAEGALRIWPTGSTFITFIVTNRGHMQWMVHAAPPSLDLLLTFLSRVVDGSDRPTIIIVNDHPLFSAPAFIDWSLRNKSRIAFNLLPAEFAEMKPFVTRHGR